VRFIDLAQHVDQLQKNLDIQKSMAREDGGINAKNLNNPDATLEQKQQALTAYTKAYASVYGININEAKVIVANQLLSGSHHSNADGSSAIFVNDSAQKNGLDYANTLGHEVTHAQIAQGTINDRGDKTLNEDYANLVGSYAADNYDFSFSNNDLGVVNTGNTNQHIGNATSVTAATNTQDYRETLATSPEQADFLLPAKVEEWRDKVNAYINESKQASADLQGDAIGTALSIAAAPGDIVMDLANLLITTVDVSTDGLGNLGLFGGELQEEAAQNLRDLGFKTADLIENKEAIAASIVQGLKDFPERIGDLDPSALRSLTAIVGEALMPAAAIAKIKAVDNLTPPTPIKVVETQQPVGNNLDVVPSEAVLPKTTTTTTQPWKHENRIEITRKDASDVNKDFIDDGWEAPYKQGTKVTEYTTKADDQFVRVHFDKNQEGTWLMKKEAVDGLTPSQIQKKYSLKHEPSLISDVKVSGGTRVRTGTVKENFDDLGGGGEGAVQYEVIDDNWTSKIEFSNPRPIGN
jgi:hypothetical protein